MFLDIGVPLLIGLGLFFVGVTMISLNLKKMTSRRLRLFFARFTGRDWQAALVGTVTGFVTQSLSVAAFIVAGLIGSGLMKVRNALPVMYFCNVGAAILILVAVLDIRYLVAILVFVFGLGMAFNKPYSHRHLVRAMFGVGLLFYGLQLIQTGAAPLAGLPWVKQSLASTHGSIILAFVLGTVLTMVTQTSIGIILVAIAMVPSGLFTMDQSIMLIYGTHVGSSCVTWLLAMGVKGTPKQLIMSQVFFNYIGSALLIVLFYVETLLGVPLVKALATTVADTMQGQMVAVVLIFNWGVPVIALPFFGLLERFLARFWPPTPEEALSKVKFILDHSMDSPDTALYLAGKELDRLLDRLPRYLDHMRRSLDQGGAVDLEAHHRSFHEIAVEIEAVLTELADQDNDRRTSEELLGLKNRLDVLRALEDALHGLCTHPAMAGTSAREFMAVVLEGLEFLVLTTVDATRSGDAEDARNLATLTSGGDLIEGVRNRYLATGQGLDLSEKAGLYALSNLFERTVWLLGRHAAVLAGREENTARTA